MVRKVDYGAGWFKAAEVGRCCGDHASSTDPASARLIGHARRQAGVGQAYATAGRCFGQPFDDGIGIAASWRIDTVGTVGISPEPRVRDRTGDGITSFPALAFLTRDKHFRYGRTGAIKGRLNDRFRRPLDYLGVDFAGSDRVLPIPAASTAASTSGR